MYISPTDAVKMYDVSKPTLYKDMNDGKLSFSKDERDRRKLNVAELDRLYEKRSDGQEALTSNNVNSQQGLTEPKVKNARLEQQVKSIRDQIEQSKNREIELLEQQIDQFKDQIENLHRHLDETREEHRIYVRLLEDKRAEQGAKTSHWDEKFQTMEHELNAVKQQNQLLLAREAERKKRIEERRRKQEAEKRLEKEKSQNFFLRLFG